MQIAGDSSGAVVHFFERDCSLQRRRQKLVEIAPAPFLEANVRQALSDAALGLARVARFCNLGTFEFLVRSGGGLPGTPAFVFIEANPRIQVEHTVTEEVTGVDLVALQLQLAGGTSLSDLGLTGTDSIRPRGFAVQARVNLESIRADGTVVPAGGRLDVFVPPAGPGVRVDTHGYPGYASNPHFDSLLAKVIGSSPSSDPVHAVACCRRALREFRIEGVATNLPFLRRLIECDAVWDGTATTQFIDANRSALIEAADSPASRETSFSTVDGTVVVAAPLRGRVVSIDIVPGDVVAGGASLIVLEAMKMEHVVAAPVGGTVKSVLVAAGEIVDAGAPLAYLEAAAAGEQLEAVPEKAGSRAIRADLEALLERRAKTLDDARPEAVERRHASGQRTARENVGDLCDPGTFAEYGALLLPAQRRRRPIEELIARYPADGLVCGFGDVNGALFDATKTRCAILAYDYTVFAGTQGLMNHKKTDRLLDVAERARLPIVLFAEGGGGRPGDTDAAAVAGLDVMTFAHYARLSALVPRIGIVAGRCFAGNAALLGCSDVIIATANATVGMGGPAMIEGGGLGLFAPEAVGPVEMQAPNGVLDIVVADEAEAVRVAKHYLSFFQGPLAKWTCGDQQCLRGFIPENRLRVYDVRTVIETIADDGSVLELRRGFAPGMIAALVRVEGRALGLLANDPRHLAGAIDADASDKAARFMQLCDAFDLPLLFLCDTPGFMVGPDAERAALVRHASRLFVTAASLRVPFFTIVLRKGYGLGAQSMAGGSFHAGAFTVAWPTGEFGAMGIEGAVRLGFRKELEAAGDPNERHKLFEQMVAKAYREGEAINMATYLEIDDVIDPADSRRWIVNGLRMHPAAPAPAGVKRRPMIDTW